MISKYLIIALLVSLSLNGLLIGVSKHYYDARAEAVRSLKSAEKTILEQQKSKELADKACVIADEVAVSLQKELSESTQQTIKEISVIEFIPRRTKKQEVVVSDDESKNLVVDIDSKLPHELVSVLSATDSRVQRQTNPNP